MERLNDIYNSNCNDNSLIIRVLNTFLEITEEPFEVLAHMLHYVELFENLYNNSTQDRPAIKFIIDKVNILENNNTYQEFVNLLTDVVDQDMNDYKFLFLICYLRSVWECKFGARIYYKTPDYALDSIANGQWNTYLKAFKSNDCVFV